MKLSIDFGTPEHGWLPMILQYGEFKLEFDVSDVPLDPMVQLCDALIQINKGIAEPSRIIWHLEPYCYYLQLIKINGEYKAIISESNGFDEPSQLTKEIVGNFKEIILPLYRSLKKFWSQCYRQPHWDELDQHRIEILTYLIKEKKT